MNDQEVLALLKKIEDGYEPTEAEKKQFPFIFYITWTRIEKVPESIVYLTRLTCLDLSYTQMATLPGYIGNLTSLKILDLSYTQMKTLPESIGNLTNLETLNLGHTQMDTLPESIGNLTNLEALNLSNSQINELPESIGNLTNLETLNLSYTQMDTLPVSIGNLTSLETLYINNSQIKKLPESIGNLTNLEALDLSYAQTDLLPENIGHLTGLEILDLSYTYVDTLPESIGNLTSLETFNLNCTQMDTLPESIGNLASLETLYLSNSYINELPESIGNLTNLQFLDMSNSHIKKLPESIGNLLSLQSLNLSNTQIGTLPESVGDLSNLSYLFLENLTLTELPESLLHLDLEFKSKAYDIMNRGPGIYIHGLRLQNQPSEVFGKSREFIEEYYKSINRGSTSPINKCKVVFLGDGGAGKSLIINRLVNDGNISDEFDGEATPGICISSKKYLIGNEEIELQFWDFGGQAIMHSMHRLFLTNRTLYIVVTNARDNKANEQAWYWLRNIKSFAKGAPVLLLVNQKDQNPSANVNENGLRKEYQSLGEVLIISALKDTKEEFLDTVSESICRMISKMETVHTPFSSSWLSLMDDLRKMPDDFIDSKDFYKKCEYHDVGTSKELLDRIISWYQDLGVCFYSRKHPTSERYMVLKPQWLLNALYILIFNGRNFAENGIIRERDIYKLLCEQDPDKNIKMVYSDITYVEDQIQYILTVLLNYELIFQLDEERFFIPMLCDENEPNNLDILDSEDTRQISFKYTYLPENVLHKLMIRHGYALDTKAVWRTGAVFYNNRCGWTSLVRMKDSCLDVFVRASNPESHPVDVYLDMMRESVCKINESFGITAQEFITFRKGNLVKQFEYEELVGNKEIGNSIVYFKGVGGVSIDGILGVVSVQDRLRGQGTTSQIYSLLDALSGVLLKLQENSDYYSAPENSCNTYVRDMMEQCGYICVDQTLRSLSGTGKTFGSPDIVILDKDSGKELSIYEAERLRGFGKTDQKYLDDHLKRLLDNYNARGLRNLLLVSYVEWGKEKFKELADKYCKYVASGKSAPYTVKDNSLDYSEALKAPVRGNRNHLSDDRKSSAVLLPERRSRREVRGTSRNKLYKFVFIQLLQG